MTELVPPVLQAEKVAPVIVGSDGPGANGGAPNPGGILAREERRAADAVRTALDSLGLDLGNRPLELRPIPFEGTWGVATMVARMVASDAVQKELESSGALADLSKKDAKRLVNEAVGPKAVEIAEGIAAAILAMPDHGFAAVEAVNGYVNISFDAGQMAARLLDQVAREGADYGKGAPKAQRVMVEHSQPNTHKAFHVGHLRNSSLGIAVSNIMSAAGYPVLQSTYPGDVGKHVIQCLWCYESFYRGQEPDDAAAKGRWLGRIYSESEARLRYRADVVAHLLLLSTEDQGFILAIDRLLKSLVRQNVQGGDIAYLLGVLTRAQELKPDQLWEDDVVPKFWPIVGDFLREAVEHPKVYVPVEGQPEPTTTAEERLNTWQELAAHMGPEAPAGDWWTASTAWPEQMKETWRRWEEREPSFVALWKETREWSLADFRWIFAELGATFDVWFFESEMEEPGRAIVRELLERGIAEIGEGGVPVVKIDEKLGLEQETYHTFPILRSDGTTLYSTKDLALTKIKFEQYGVDRAFWVVDVRQSLYFQQVFKVLELWGFDQVRDAHHIPYEFVALPEGTISSRKGNAPLYEDFRDAILARAREIIEAKNPEMSEERKAEVARQVGLGAAKYAMLARDNNKVVVFDLDEALSFDGHSAPYIQYAHARACRILDKDGQAGRRGGGKDDDSLPTSFAPEELSLLQQIAEFPEEIERAAEEYRPLLITNYVYELAKRFNDFYHACPVLTAEEPTRSSRLRLVDGTRQTLANGLALLGIAAPAEM